MVNFTTEVFPRAFINMLPLPPEKKLFLLLLLMKNNLLVLMMILHMMEWHHKFSALVILPFLLSAMNSLPRIPLPKNSPEVWMAYIDAMEDAFPKECDYYF